jgi:hypothetical protein
MQMIQLVPQVGVASEVYASNRQYGQLVPNTAGDVLLVNLDLKRAEINCQLELALCCLSIKI